ncbi:MAG: glucokinase [bacterium]|jgi:glucokinase
MSEKRLVIGIDVGGTSIKFGVVSDQKELLFQESVPTDKTDPAKSFQEIKTCLDDFFLSAVYDWKDVVGCGIGIPGAIAQNNQLAFPIVNLKSWSDFPYIEYLSELFQVKVQLGNDATLAAFGEQWVNQLEDISPLLIVTLGTGVGGGIIINGKPLYGYEGCGGEIGHLFVNPDGILCPCGQIGCLETISSATGIVRLYQEQVPNSALSAKEVMDLARTGDLIAKSVLQIAGETLGKALSHILTILDPERIVLGGQVSKSFDLLQPYVLKGIQKYLNHSFDSNRLQASQHPAGAGIFGAARVALLEA